MINPSNFNTLGNLKSNKSKVYLIHTVFNLIMQTDSKTLKAKRRRNLGLRETSKDGHICQSKSLFFFYIEIFTSANETKDICNQISLQQSYKTQINLCLWTVEGNLTGWGDP